jgi:hypothetical protein
MRMTNDPQEIETLRTGNIPKGYSLFSYGGFEKTVCEISKKPLKFRLLLLTVEGGCLMINERNVRRHG